MNEFRCLNFGTLYNYRGTLNSCDGEELKDGYVSNHACFATLTRILSSCDKNEKLSETYNLIVFPADNKFVLESRISNKCFLTKKQLLYYVKSLEGVVGISDISIETATISSRFKFNTPDNTLEGYKLIFSIDDIPVAHKFALFYIRRVYEFPYNMRILDIYRVRNTHRSVLSGIPLFTLYSLYQLTFNCLSNGHEIGFGTYSLQPTKDSLKKIVHAGRDNSLDNMIGYSYDYKYTLKRFAELVPSTTKCKEGLGYSMMGGGGNLEDWTEPDRVKKRDEYYLDMVKRYKTFIQKKKKK